MVFNIMGCGRGFDLKILSPGFPPSADRSSSAKSWWRVVLPSLIDLVLTLPVSMTSPNGLKSAWVKGIGVIDRATSFSHFSPFNCAVSPSVPISAATKSPKRWVYGNEGRQTVQFGACCVRYWCNRWCLLGSGDSTNEERRVNLSWHEFCITTLDI